MSDTLKIQMTEEQARMFLHCTVVQTPEQREESIMCAKQAGYILKSSLQQKVEEAENFYKNWDDRGEVDMCHKRLYECVQLLKQSHPEFKK